MAEEVQDVNKWDAIVDTFADEETKIVPTDPVDSTEEVAPSKWDAMDFDKSDKVLDITYDDTVELDVEEYRDEFGADVFLPQGDNGIDILNQERAERQPWYDQAGNFLAQSIAGEIIGGSIEGIGYLLDVGSIVDVMQGDEADWGNFISDFGQGIRETTEENFRIHQDPSATGWGKMADSGWWFSNSVSIASTLSMLIPTTGAMKALSFVGKGLAASKGLGTVRKAMGMAEKMGTKGKWMSEGITQAVLSRNIENWMEAHGTYEDSKAEFLESVDPETGEKYTDEKANALASDAAADNWKLGWAMLAQDIPQYLALGKVFNPISKKMENVKSMATKKGIGNGMKPWQSKTAELAKTFVSEGGEESYQFLIAERAKLKSKLDSGLIDQEEYNKEMSDAFGSEEMMTSAFFGGLGGNVFQAAGSGWTSAVKSKSRKEYEEKIGKYYGDMVTNKGKNIAVMYQQLAKADQEGSPVMREAILNEMMMSATAEALEADKYELFMETIDNMQNMSEEDVATLAKDGADFSTDLAKQYAPEIKRKAERMREQYLALRNQYSKTTSSRIAKIAIENEAMSSLASEKSRQISKFKEELGSVFTENATPEHSTRLETKDRGTVLRARKKDLKDKLAAEKSPILKTFIQKSIDQNELKLKKQARDTRLATKARQEARAGLTKDDRDILDAQDDLATEAYDASRDNILGALTIKEKADEKVAYNTEAIKFAKSDEGAILEKAQKIKQEVSNITTNEQAEEFLKDVEDADYLDQAEKDDLKEAVAKKQKGIKVAEDEAEATRKAEEIDSDRSETAHTDNENLVHANNDVHTDIAADGIVEDENAFEEVNTSSKIIDEEYKATKIGTGELALLDKVAGTEAFQRWSEKPESKKGREFGYTVSTSPQSDLQRAAVDDFNTLLNGGEISSENRIKMWDNLPIQATLVPEKGEVSEGNKIFTFLPTKPVAGSSLEDTRNYQRGYAEQRAAIISKLLKGEEVKAKVLKSSGGELVNDKDHENNRAPENSILELQQIANDMNNVEILVTNKLGELMDTLKELDPDLGHGFISVGEDKKGARMPYRGGVFLKVKKANGEYFPLRLNLLRNTREQSELIADLMMRIYVPVVERDAEGNAVRNEKTKKPIWGKELDFSTTIDQVDPELKALIEKEMMPEIEMLDKEYKNPTVGELISTFVYMSEEGTKNKTSELYVGGEKGNSLVFGGKGSSIGIKERNSPEAREELIEFLQNFKRRQFNLNQWNSNSDYRDYVIENKVISTNASTNVPMFQNLRERDSKTGKMNEKRRIQMYMTPVTAPTEAGNYESSTKNDIPTVVPVNRETTEDGTAFRPIGMKPKPVAPVKKADEVKTSEVVPTKPEASTRTVSEMKTMLMGMSQSELVNRIMEGEAIVINEQLVNPTLLDKETLVDNLISYQADIDQRITDYIAMKKKISNAPKLSAKTDTQAPLDLETLTDERDAAVKKITGITSRSKGKVSTSYTYQGVIRGVRIKNSDTEQGVIDQIDAILEPLMLRALGQQTPLELLESYGEDFRIQSFEAVVSREEKRGTSEMQVAQALINASDEQDDLGSILHTVKQHESRNIANSTVGERRKLSKYDAAVEDLKSREQLEGVSATQISEMPSEAYAELIETGYTMWTDKDGEAADATWIGFNESPKTNDTKISKLEKKPLSSQLVKPGRKPLIHKPKAKKTKGMPSMPSMLSGTPPINTDTSKMDSGKKDTKC
jgi:hypothetical protein